MIRDIFFNIGGYVEFNARVIAVDRTKWTALKCNEAKPEKAIQIMKENSFDVLPIDDGLNYTIHEYFYTKKINVWSKDTVVKKLITYNDVLPAQTLISELIHRFADSGRRFFFLTTGDYINALVTRANLNSRPVRIWLYALLCEFEIRLSQLIKLNLKSEYIQNMLTETNKEILNSFQEDRKRGVENEITEYLYLSNLLNIVRKEKIYKFLGYKSGKQFEKLNSLNDLRDQIMHPVRLLINEDKPIEKLWERIQLLQEALFRSREYQLF